MSSQKSKQLQWETLNKYKYCVGKVKTGNSKINKKPM